jgi:hypothetical protein
LIVLEIRKRTIPNSPSRASPNRTSSPPRQTRLDYVLQFEKTSFASNISGIFAVRLRSRLVCSRLQVRRWARNLSRPSAALGTRPDMLPLHNVRFPKETNEPNSSPGYRIPLKPPTPPLNRRAPPCRTLRPSQNTRSSN